MGLFVKKYQLVISYYFFFLSILLLIVNVLFFVLMLFDTFLFLGNYPPWSMVFIVIHFLVSWGMNRLSCFFIKKLREDIKKSSS